jgi:parvulin-like peptidyl-prolyl isomerase
MGLMNRMRDKTHIILIILVLAFLATIVFEWGMNYLGLRGGQTVEFGSVNGQEITYQEFESQMQMAVQQQKQQTGEDPDDATMQMIRDQVWDQTVTQILIQQEIQKLGIRVTDQEILNWVYNSPQTLPDPIKRNFIDSTGTFNMTVYQQALATKTPEVTKFWSQVETYLKQLLLSQKLQSVITGTIRVSESDVLQKYKDENIFASFNYLFQDVNSIPDNQVQVTENDLKNYYEKNKEDYKEEASVKMKYVLFPDNATAEDSSLTVKQLKALTKELKRYNEGDSDLINLVNTNSTNKYNDKFVKPSEVAPEVASFLFFAKKDSISDVIEASDGYHLVKLLDSKEGEDVFTNAAHILISFGTDTNAAKVKAEEVYRRVKLGEDFSTLASTLSDDPGSKQKGGNLGWFTKGTMVKEFEDAVTSAKLGDIVGPIKSQFGFHIIKVLDRQKKTFKIADIKKLVTASSKTKDAARKRAEDFAYISNKGNFDEEARLTNLQVLDVPPITKSSFIPGAGQNKNVTKFAFSEGVNSISDPIKIQGGFAVYKITDKIKEGYMNYDEIKNTTVLPKVKNEKKLDLIKQIMLDLKSKIANNDLKSLKTVNPQMNILQADSFSVSKPNPAIGSDFSFNDALFKLQDGQISEPIRTQKGYYLVQMLHVTPFDQNKYLSQSDAIRNSLLEQKKQTFVQEWLNDLKDKSKIVDNRDKFFR